MRKIADAKWTDEELANLPQTTKVFDAPKLDMNSHQWQQQGYMLTDICAPSRPDCQHVGIPIPAGKTLIKIGGKYDLVDEDQVATLMKRKS